MTGNASDLEVRGDGKRVALIVSRFNEDITRELAAGAREALLQSGVADDDIDEYSVAGAFELAPGCRQVLTRGPEVDAIVALGAVIRGETPHFEFISRAAVESLQRLAIEIDIPLGCGVLTTDSREQAIQRASRRRGNKGGDAARAALAQATLYERLQAGAPSVRGFRIP
ncbi:MAG TPA: 6,7-dimethyl-8-ribityllumazine synthase [Gemmatimonadota bacterium]|nr:6,7-dimethyl-8-ribityllumazine synthase [Gemmatimonadota bacterium]